MLSGFRRLAAVALAAAGLGACSAARELYEPTRWVYEKKDTTPARLDRDMTACRRVALDRSRLAATSAQRIDREKFNRCMERQGYTVRTAED
jgi:hypothetical protein